MAAARRGDWRAAAFLYERVHGKPTDHLITESRESEADRWIDSMSLEELEQFRNDLARSARQTMSPAEVEALPESPGKRALRAGEPEQAPSQTLGCKQNRPRTTGRRYSVSWRSLREAP
jgi:hypothetical protein